MAVVIPTPGQIVLTAAADAVTLSGIGGMYIQRMYAVTNGTTATAGQIEVLDEVGGRRLATNAGNMAGTENLELLVNARVKGLYVNALVTNAEIHVYHK